MRIIRIEKNYYGSPIESWVNLQKLTKILQFRHAYDISITLPLTLCKFDFNFDDYALAWIWQWTCRRFGINGQFLLSFRLSFSCLWPRFPLFEKLIRCQITGEKIQNFRSSISYYNSVNKRITWVFFVFSYQRGASVRSAIILMHLTCSENSNSKEWRMKKKKTNVRI